MKKIQIFSLVLGAAALVAGAAVYTAAKFAGRDASSRHDAEGRLLEGPVAPETDAADEQEVKPEEPEQEEPEKSSEEEPDAAPAAEAEFVDYAAKAPEKAPEKAQEVPEPVDLEQYMYINPEKMESLNVVKDSFAAEGVKTDISFTDNTMFFDFVMTDVDDEKTEEALKPDLEAFLKDQTEVYTNIVKQLEEDSGFDDIKMIVIFMDANENEIVSGHYDETGKTM